MASAPVRHAGTSVASEEDMKPGNRKGTNPGPPDRTGRTNRTALVLITPPHVRSSTAANCGPPFGTKRPQVQILSPRPVFLQVIPEGAGPCQGIGDLRFGLFSTAAHTSKWASGSRLGRRARPRSGRRALRLAPGSTNNVGGEDSSGAVPQKSEWVGGALVKAGVPAGGQARVGCRSSLRRGRGRHDGVRGALAGGVNQRGDHARCWGS